MTWFTVAVTVPDVDGIIIADVQAEDKSGAAEVARSIVATGHRIGPESVKVLAVNDASG